VLRRGDRGITGKRTPPVDGTSGIRQGRDTLSDSRARESDAAGPQAAPENGSAGSRDERAALAPLLARHVGGRGMNGALADAANLLQRTAGNRAARRILARDELELSDPFVPDLVEGPSTALLDGTDPAIPLDDSAKAPAATAVKMLVIYTGGDTRQTSKKGKQAANAPKTYEDLHRMRAQEVGGSGAIIRTFATISDATTFLNDPANKGITEIRFVGHGDPGLFAFHVTPTADGHLTVNRATDLLDIDSPDATFVKAMAAAATSKTLKVHVEACNTGGGRLANFAKAMGTAGLKGSLSGYDVDVITNFKGSLGKTIITDKQGSEAKLQKHLNSVTVP